MYRLRLYTWSNKDPAHVYLNKPTGRCVCALLDLPLVTVGELHVHAVSAEEGSAVHWCVDVGWVWDGFTHQDSTGERRLPEPAQPSRGTAVVHFQLSGAVQHLPIGDNERPNVNNSALKTQIIKGHKGSIFWKANTN